MPKRLSVGLCNFTLFMMIFLSQALYALSSYKGNAIKNNLISRAHSQPISSKKTFSVQLQPVFSLTTGVSISTLGQALSFAPLDLCSYNYNSPVSNITKLLWGGFAGSKVRRFTYGELIAGLGFYQPHVLSTKGFLTQGADAVSSNTYNYKYQIQSRQLLVESKLYCTGKEGIHPYLMIGIGAAFNKISHYQTNVPSFLEFTPIFPNHTQANWSYAIGPGMDVSLSKSFRIGLAYRFAYLGSAQSGSARIDGISISNRLNQSQFYANQILAQCTFIPEIKD